MKNILTFGVLGAITISSLSYFRPQLALAATDSSELIDIAVNVEPQLKHCDEAVESREFMAVFECGDALFETRFNALDGVGMDVGDGGRFTRMPRADLSNWVNSLPARETGPNAEACNVCHVADTIGGAGDGAGPAGLNVIRDPLHHGTAGSFIQRNTPHLFGMAGPQLLAEEMTAKLKAIVARTTDAACASSTPVTGALRTKNIDFGSVTVTPPCPGAVVDLELQGIDEDLVIKPFQWKGNMLSIRSFSRDAFHNELGMTPVELSGDGIDSDFDSVADEVSIADNTAMVIYLAGQPRPTTLVELDSIRNKLKRYGRSGAKLANELLLPNLTSTEKRVIQRGEKIFSQIGCADCHRQRMQVENTVFTSPSQNSAYREETFPGGQNAIASGVDPDNPISFDITRDQPDNIVELRGKIIRYLGSFEKTRNGGAVIEMLGDLKRHEMGPRLAESIDETGSGASVWQTKELWGLANTAPYLHDGRATTVEEAIIEHGGESEAARDEFIALSARAKASILAYLNNLVLFFPDEEE